jgi:hypothetical protein
VDKPETAQLLSKGSQRLRKAEIPLLKKFPTKNRMYKRNNVEDLLPDRLRVSVLAV